MSGDLSEDSLVISPILDWKKQVGIASVDVRLGNEFITFRTSSFPYMDIPSDPAKIEQKIYRYQRKFRIDYGERLILHPSELVLGATFEYMRIPKDLLCYVIGRSSWGRLGLTVATATVVEPGFRGCITLELVNSGVVPIALVPGCRIAQLVFHPVRGAGRYEGKKYTCPTGPQEYLIVLDSIDGREFKRFPA